jgi:hypothetical protein
VFVLRSDLPKDRAQFVKVHGLGQMKIETGFLTALDIVGLTKSSQRYGLYRVFSLGLGNLSPRPHFVHLAEKSGPGV